MQLEIGSIDLSTVIYFTAESEAYHPFEDLSRLTIFPLF